MCPKCGCKYMVGRSDTAWKCMQCDEPVDFPEIAAQQSVQLTALRRGLAVSIFINVVLLAVVMFTIGGN